MKKFHPYVMATALLLVLLPSCVSEDETSEAIHQKDLTEIQAFIDNTSLVTSRQAQVGNTGITLLFTEENPSGKAVELGDTLMVNYTGYFLDGKVFDTSVEQVAKDNDLHSRPSENYKPLPVRLGYGGVIEGWHYALAQMKEGEKATVLLPSEFAYGPYGQGPIKPNTVLAFDLELVEVVKP